jgi:hypothetical protein
MRFGWWDASSYRVRRVGRRVGCECGLLRNEEKTREIATRNWKKTQNNNKNYEERDLNHFKSTGIVAGTVLYTMLFTAFEYLYSYCVNKQSQLAVQTSWEGGARRFAARYEGGGLYSDTRSSGLRPSLWGECSTTVWNSCEWFEQIELYKSLTNWQP